MLRIIEIESQTKGMSDSATLWLRFRSLVKNLGVRFRFGPVFLFSSRGRAVDRRLILRSLVKISGSHSPPG